MKPTWKRIALSILLGGIAVLGIYADAVFLLLPAIYGFVWAAWGSACVAAALGTAAVALFACFGGSLDALYALGLFVPASLCVGYCLRNKKPYRTAAVSAAAAIAAGCYCLLCLPSIIAGKGPFAGVEEMLLAVADAMKEVGGQLTGSGTAVAPEAVENVVESIRSASLLAPEITCAMIVASGMAFGLLDVVLARRMAFVAKVELRPMAPFGLWQLSKNYTVSACVLLAAAVVTLLLRLNNASAVLIVAECVVLLPILLMGMCFMDFLTRVTAGNGALRRAISYVCIILLFPYSAVLLLILGLVDRVTRLRRRFRVREDKEQK